MQKYENPAQSVIFFEGSQTGTNWVQRYFVLVKKNPKQTPCNMKYVVFFFRKSDIAAWLLANLFVLFIINVPLHVNCSCKQKGSEMKKGKVDSGESAQKKHKAEAEVKHCKN